MAHIHTAHIHTAHIHMAHIHTIEYGIIIQCTFICIFVYFQPLTHFQKIKNYIYLSNIKQNKMTASFSEKKTSGFTVPATGEITTVSFALTDSVFEKNLISKIELLSDFYEKKADKIQKEIESAGFSCTGCARCCQREDADNTVFLLPQEIEMIENATGMNKRDFILPLFPDFYTVSNDSSVRIEAKRFAEILKTIPDQINEKGYIHTFGWMLQRDENGRCAFLNEKTKKCAIYDIRPGLCRTYPFYLSENGVEDCECEGLLKNSKTDRILACELAKDVMKRPLAEQDDYLRTQQYVKTKSGQDSFNMERGVEKASNDLEAGILKFVVYDGRGIHHTEICIRDYKPQL